MEMSLTIEKYNVNTSRVVGDYVKDTMTKILNYENELHLELCCKRDIENHTSCLTENKVTFDIIYTFVKQNTLIFCLLKCIS